MSFRCLLCCVITLLLSVTIAAQEPAATSAGPSNSRVDVLKPGGDTKPPQLLEAPDPEYPSQERNSGRTGAVILSAVVAETGHTQDIKVVKSFGEEFDRNAIEAVRKWRFKPGTREGRPVAAQINVEVRFGVDDGSSEVFRKARSKVLGKEKNFDFDAISKTAQTGNRYAQLLLGCLFTMGTKAPYVSAGRSWLEKAAEQGSATGALLLGEVYRDGIGGEPDYVASYKWMFVAKKSRISPGGALEDVRQRINDRQVAEAEAAAKEFLATHRMEKDLR